MDLLAEVWEFFTDPAHWAGAAGIPNRTYEHTLLSLVSVAAGIAVALPPAVWLGHRRKGTVIASAVVNIGRAVPSFGILAIGLIFTISIGLGLGAWPTFMALFALAVPPIFTNAVTAVTDVDGDVVEAARGMGMTELQIVTRVELPLGLPLILEGVRVALTQVIATATLAALVAWGGLGRFIIDGFAQRDNAELIAGAILVAMLAIMAEVGFGAIERAVGRHLGLRPRVGGMAFRS